MEEFVFGRIRLVLGVKAATYYYCVAHIITIIIILIITIIAIIIIVAAIVIMAHNDDRIWSLGLDLISFCSLKTQLWLISFCYRWMHFLTDQ